MENHNLSKTSRSRLKGVKRGILQLLERVLKKNPFDFGVPEHGGKRTAQEQNNLFNSRTSSGKRITQLDGFNGISYHQSGKSFDIFIYDEHGACWKCHEKYRSVASFMKQEFDFMKGEGIFSEKEELFWGGDWTRFKDRPHFEIRAE